MGGVLLKLISVGAASVIKVGVTSSVGAVVGVSRTPTGAGACAVNAASSCGLRVRVGVSDGRGVNV